MTEPLSKEQLDAIRERQAAVKATALKEHEARQALEQDGSAAEKHYALINAEFEWEDARRHAEAFADEDIEALLAHIDAQGEMIARLSNELAGTHEHLQDIIDGNQTGSNDPLENYERLQEDLTKLRELDMRVVQAARSLLLG